MYSLLNISVIYRSCNREYAYFLVTMCSNNWNSELYTFPLTHICSHLMSINESYASTVAT